MNKLIWPVLLLAGATLCAQENPSLAEQQSLQQSLSEAGNSPVDLIRAVENHLKQYPNAPSRPQLEAALAKTAIDLKDDPRIVLYGTKVLAREPGNIQMLERVIPALLRKADQASAAQALDYARHYEQLIQATVKNEQFAPEGGGGRGQAQDDYDRGVASARLLQARAHGLLGHGDEADPVSRVELPRFPQCRGGGARRHAGSPPRGRIASRSVSGGRLYHPARCVPPIRRAPAIGRG